MKLKAEYQTIYDEIEKINTQEFDINLINEIDKEIAGLLEDAFKLMEFWNYKKRSRGIETKYVYDGYFDDRARELLSILTQFNFNPDKHLIIEYELIRKKAFRLEYYDLFNSHIGKLFDYMFEVGEIPKTSYQKKRTDSGNTKIIIKSETVKKLYKKFYTIQEDRRN